MTSGGGRPGAVAYVLCEAFAIGLAATAALSSAFLSIVLLGVAALISIGWAVGRAPLVQRSPVTIARGAAAPAEWVHGIAIDSAGTTYVVGQYFGTPNFGDGALPFASQGGVMIVRVAP